jgi:hypothetical protein
MKFAFLLVPVTAVLAATPLQSQEAAAPPARAVTSEVLAWAPQPAQAPWEALQVLAPSAMLEEAEQRRSGWRYPLLGMAAGAVAGAALGAYVMASADEYMAAPAFFLTVPAGALAGLALGGVANLIDPR